MNKFISLVLFFCAFLLTSCNGVGGKDTIVARIGNENLYAEDLDFLALQGLGDTSSEGYKNGVENILYSLALVSKVNAESGAYDSAWKVYEPVVSSRLLAITYTRQHLIEKLGYSDDELKKYFEEHRSEFDSSASYLLAREKVADRFYIANHQDSLKKYIQKTLPGMDVAAKVRLLLFAGDSVAVSEMEKKINAGISVDSLPTMRRVRVEQGHEKGVFKDSSVIRALFFADSMAVGTGRSFAVKDDSSMTYFALKLLERKAPVKAREEDFRSQLEKNFVAEHRETIVKQVQESMTQTGSVRIEKLVPADPQKFYQEHLDMFKTAPGYEVYHVCMKDSSVLAKTMANVKDLESFKAVAGTVSENAETSENMGLVGRVKKNYALPYGIGMMPALFSELEGKQAGYISSVIRSVSDSLYHCFYVSAVIPSETKPFDRVEKTIESMYADDVEHIDPSTVLVTCEGKPVYTKADMLKIFDAEQGIPYNKNTHHNIVKMLAQSYYLAEQARKAGVDKSWEFRALVRVARMEFIVKRYGRNASHEQSEPPQVPENMKKFEYYFNVNGTYKDKTYEEALPQVSMGLGSRLRMNWSAQQRMNAWNNAKVSFYDRSKVNLAPLTTAEGFLALADSLSKEQKFDGAIKACQKVIELFADKDSLFRAAVFSLAQAYADAQKYEDAVNCYGAFLAIWPESPDAEKALFSRGFILNENLHQDSLALVVLEDFQNRFPKSELKESVDWLVENIKSGGKLADDLMKKIESEE